MEGGKKALWSMMEAARGAGVALLSDTTTHVAQSGAGTAAVYFDCKYCYPLYSMCIVTSNKVFAAALVIFPLSSLLTANIVLLIIGPTLLLLLVMTVHFVERLARCRLQNDPQQVEDLLWRRAWVRFRRMSWLKGVWKKAKFWLALVITILLQVLLSIGYVKLNPFVSYLVSFQVVPEQSHCRSYTLIHIWSSYLQSPSPIFPWF
jgi:hypothetical protein